MTPLRAVENIIVFTFATRSELYFPDSVPRGRLDAEAFRTDFCRTTVSCTLPKMVNVIAARNSVGWTLLMEAASTGDADILELVIALADEKLSENQVIVLVH